jgi:hypothetical protein
MEETSRRRQPSLQRNDLPLARWRGSEEGNVGRSRADGSLCYWSEVMINTKEEVGLSGIW